MIGPRRYLLLFVVCSVLLLVILLHRSTTTPQDRWRNLSASVAPFVGMGEWSSRQQSSQLPITDNADFNHLTDDLSSVSLSKLNFRPGIAKPPGSNYSVKLVIPRTRRENVAWITEDLPEFDTAIYVANDAKAPLHPPKNKGHEVMIYLTYIIDNYSDLPDVMIFMHAHRRAWHNNEILGADAVQIIRRLSPERVVREGYMNLRCQWYPGCPDWMHPGETEVNKQKTEQVLIAQAWAEIFPMDPVPDVLAQPCCSQFALSRERIRTIPLERFISFRDWLLRTRLRDTISGRVWEYMWQYVFTGQNSHCPVEHICYCDGFGVCFGGKADYDAWWTIRYERDKYNKELLAWTEKGTALNKATAKGGNIADLEIPEDGKDEVLEAQIKALQEEMDRRTKAAIDRGNDPKNRALEAGRPWKEGDGF